MAGPLADFFADRHQDARLHEAIRLHNELPFKPAWRRRPFRRRHAHGHAWYLHRDIRRQHGRN